MNLARPNPRLEPTAVGDGGSIRASFRRGSIAGR